MFRQIIIAALLTAVGSAVHAASLQDIQREWAVANYRLEGDAQVEALQRLVLTTEQSALKSGGNAELLIWDGIVKSTLAGKKGGLSALSLVKDARKSLERAMNADPGALNGSAYTSLGALYYQVPGWPLAFGDDKKARELLERAVSINPNGIDSNYFYGAFLVEQKEFSAARTALEHALAAADRPDRPLADEGRRGEIRSLLESLPE